MKYLCLVYLEDAKFTAVPDRECQNCGDGLRQEGRLLLAEPLFPVRTAKTVQVRDGRVAITDGPFAETKEQLAGFYLIDAASRRSAADCCHDPAGAKAALRSARSGTAAVTRRTSAIFPVMRLHS